MIEKTTSDNVKVNDKTLKAIQSGKKKSLAEAFPEIAAEWHPTKNDSLTPEIVSAGSGKKVWWQCEYGHEWKSSIDNRSKGKGCPSCSKNGTSRPELTLLYYIRKHISPDAIHRYRDLGFEIDIYIPELCIGIEHDGYVHLGKEIEDITKNKKCLENDIKLYRIRDDKLSELNDSSIDYFYKYGDDKAFSTVISKLLFDISGTEININTVEDFAEINDFIKYVKIENSLAKHNPELAAEWHPTKNGSLTPEMVTPGSDIIVRWKCKLGHEWQSIVGNRTRGSGCPYCAGKKVLPGFNDLSTINPNLAKEWHPTKNGTLTPELVSAGNGKKVWWQCKHGHAWEASVVSRTKGNGCPYCSGKRPIPGITDLTTTHPEIATEWHPTKNEILTPQDVTKGSGKKIWWQCTYGHEWQAKVANRTNGNGCPYCLGKHPVPGITDLATTHPELVTEWNHTMNGDLTPETVSAGSDKKVWWKCKKEHKWQATISSRAKGAGCPYCAGKKVLPGFNDLSTINPNLAKEWHPTKNGDLTPEMVTAGSGKKIWWQCEHGHEWDTSVVDRAKYGCPYCSGRLPIPGATDLATTHPALVTQWHPTQNGDLTPTKISRGYSKPVYWQCTHCGHEYQRPPYEQTRKNRKPRCPHCKTPVNAAKSA